MIRRSTLNRRPKDFYVIWMLNVWQDLGKHVFQSWEFLQSAGLFSQHSVIQLRQENFGIVKFSFDFEQRINWIQRSGCVSIGCFRMAACAICHARPSPGKGDDMN